MNASSRKSADRIPSASPSRDSNAPAAPTRTRVFIVDDHPIVREWLAKLLNMQHDLEVTGQADDAAHGLAEMVARPPDVAIVDLSLPRGSGLELIKDVRRQLPGTQVVVLSMREEIGDVERALRAGARGYVMKRQSSGEIVNAVRHARTSTSGGSFYADPTVLGALAVRLLHPQPDHDPHSPEVLSDRELEIFRRLGEGHSTRRIADDLQLSFSTVQTHHARIREKLGLSDATAVLRIAVQWVNDRR